MRRSSQNPETMSPEQISPELVLVDSDLAARARASLPEPVSVANRTPSRPVPQVSHGPHVERHYPFWARVTAALWLLVLGILVGGTAIPHAQDKPRLIPKDEDPAVCRVEPRDPTIPPVAFGPGGP